MDPLEMAVKVALFFVPFLFALCFHEFAHGFVAKLRGDDTAEMMGRLTMNPLAHVDWIGTVGLPIVAILTGMPLFGWAKPVPVNSRNLKDPKNDMFWVALAGPLSNILLFVLGLVATFVVFRVLRVPLNSPLFEMLKMFLYINLLLAFFNMLPLHPLDGGKVLQRFIPYHWNRWLEDHQYHLNMALLLLIISGGFSVLARPILYIMQTSLTLVLTGAV
ncbi:MAG: site-2 protease family protein [Pseudomonadota bacterium]